MLKGSVFDELQKRLDPSVGYLDDKKKRCWYDIKRVGVDGKKKHRRHSASFFAIPARDNGISKLEFYEKKSE